MQRAKSPRPPGRDRLRVLTRRPLLLLAITAIATLGLSVAAWGVQRGRPPESTVRPSGDEQVIEGTDENDTLDGGDGADWIYGEAGDDLLRGYAGDDMLEGRAGDDILDGGADSDVLDGGDGSDRLFGGAGDDVLDGGDQDDILDGGEGDDNLSGGDGADLLSGGPGNDTVYGDDGDDVVKGGEGNDRLYGNDGADMLHGGNGDDLLDGGDASDVLLGGPGADRLVAGEADDIARGGAGEDLLLGGPGLDLLDGGPGADRIYGGLHDDVLLGGQDADLLQGGRGADDASGGDGDDIFRLRAGDGVPGQIDKVDGGEGADTILLNGFPAGVCAEDGGVAAKCSDGLVDPESGGAIEVRGVEAVRHEHVTTSITDGANARVVLVNPTARTVVAHLQLFASDGAMLAGAGAVGENDDAGGDEVERERSALTVPPYARLAVNLSASMPGSSVTLRVEADERLIVVLQQGEGSAAVEAPVADSFYMPFADPGDTTLLVVKGSVGGTVKVDYLRGGGGEVDSYEVRVGAHGHVVLAMAEMFPDASTEGILRIEGGELGVAGSIADVERGAGALSAIPASIDFSTGNVGPPVAGGARYISGLLGRGEGSADIFVFNPGTAEAKGFLGFYDGTGQPVSMAIEGHGSVTTVPVELRGGGVMTVTISAATADAYAVLQTEEGAADAVLGRSRAGSYLATRAQRPGAGRAFAILGPTEAGLVELRIVAAEQANVTLQLRDAEGNPVTGGKRTVDLGAGAAVSATLAALFPNLGTESLDGSLHVVASRGTIVATGLMVSGEQVHILPSVQLR